MFYYVYTDHAQYTIKTYAKMALFPLLLTGYLLPYLVDSTTAVDLVCRRTYTIDSYVL